MADLNETNANRRCRLSKTYFILLFKIACIQVKSRNMLVYMTSMKEKNDERHYYSY